MSVVDVGSISSSVVSRPLTVLVFFRGEWCPFCQSYLRELDRSFRERVEAAGGRVVAITSQSTDAVRRLSAAWGLRLDVASDPDNTWARRFDVAITPKEATILAADPVEYPHGMAQPAVVALDADGRVLYRWAIEPSTMNLGGASDRPLPDDLWAAIEAARTGAPAPAPGARRLDPEFLAERYPEQHATFLAWVASSNA